MSFEDQMAEIAKTVARRYARRCWWAEREDLEHQAWVGVLEVRRWFEIGIYGPDKVPFFGSFAYRAAWSQVGRYLVRQSSPVSCATDDMVGELIKTSRGTMPWGMVDEAPTPETAFADIEALVEEIIVVRPAIAKRIAELYDGHAKEHAAAGMAIYLEGVTPREAARLHGLDIYGLYKTTARMRVIFRKDRKLRKFVEELVEGRS